MPSGHRKAIATSSIDTSICVPRPVRPAQECRRDRLGRRVGGGLVDDAVSDHGRLAALGLDRGEPRQRLHDVVVRRRRGQRPGGAEAADRRVDERGLAAMSASAPRPRRSTTPVRKFCANTSAPPPVAAQGRGRRGSTGRRRSSAFPVDVREVGAHAAAASPDAADGVAVERLDLDDVGALVGQHHRRQRTRHVARQIDHPDPCQRQRSGDVPHLGNLGTLATWR